ncbi:MAG: HEAT repeat domain-containing protein [Planctomycetales bacterium]|nr:HEAT repeat domain-containing protein [Planctomycetales bacterium]
MASFASGQEPDWLTRLQSSDADEQLSALEGLVNAPTDSITSAVAKAVQKLATDAESTSVRATACRLLGEKQLLPATTIPILIRACADQEGDPGEKVYQLAGPALAAFKEQSIPVLRKLLTSGDPDQVIAAGFALDHVGAYAADLVDPIVEILRRNERRTAPAMINAVKRIGPPAAKAVPELQRYLEHEDFHIRYWTCQALGSIGAAAAPATKQLLVMLEKDNASVRRHAAAAVGGIGPAAGEDAVDGLIQALSDAVQPVQVAAVVALGDMAPVSGRALPNVQVILGKPSFNARAQAALAMWKLDPGNAEAVDLLLEQLNREGSALEAIEAISAVGADMKIGPEVAMALKATAPAVRESAALALAGMGAAAEPQLGDLRAVAAADEDEEVREVAAAAVKQIEAAVAKARQSPSK